VPRLKTKNSAKPPGLETRQNLERRILHGIACEWETARAYLSPAQHEFMRRPLFAIKDLKDQWGHWSSTKREITLSCKLVFNYPWDSIRDVLLHETAHQIAHQVLRATSETAHGPAFKRACAILGIEPVASSSYVPLQDRLLCHSAGEHDRRKIRIKKLLALAESHNRYEAEAAMLKAHELIAKYNITNLGQDSHDDLISVFIGKPALRHPKETYFLSNLIQDFYFVRGLWISAYVMQKAKMGRVLEISGRIENIKLASYVYDFIRHTIDAHWSDYNQSKKFNRYRKSDFAVGVIEGFRNKLTDYARQQSTRKIYRAVIRKTDSSLAQYFDYRYPHTVNIRKKVSHQNETILADGKKIGRKLVITKAVSSRHRGRVRLLGE
jgi:hypothetical protein